MRAVTTYHLAQFVADLRLITAKTKDPNEVVDRVRPLARELALTRTWLRPEHYETNRTTLSLHVRGKHPNYTGRWQFDPERRIEQPFAFKDA